jgi:hypothetical protein
MAALANLLHESQSELLEAKSLALNPRFAASGALGGADADLIADGTLVDVKTSKDAKIDRALVWQLLGYVLADLDDEHKIERVAVYFSRQGELRSWAVPDLIALLAGQEVRVSDLRGEFRLMLDRYRAEQLSHAPATVALRRAS